MRTFLSLTLILLLSVFMAQGQKTDKRLQQKVEALCKDFKGDYGVYVKNLRTGKITAVHADTIFPTASMIKVPILIGIMDKMNQGELSYHQKLIYKDSLLYPGEDILGSFKDSEAIELAKVMMLSLTTSDNTASLWLQSLAGTGTRINEIMDSLGMKSTRVNSRTPGRAANQKLYGWGQTTPREMATLFEMIYKGQLFSPAASERMLRCLGRNFWDERAISAIPPYIFVASKNGAVFESRSATLLVMAPHGPYVFSIITKNIEDQSWVPENEAWQLIKNLSSLLWQYYEPNADWRPSEKNW